MQISARDLISGVASVYDAHRVLEHGVARLWMPRRHGFAYQQGRVITSRTVFLRWSQAWMLRALCDYLAHRERLA